ncbi:MAG: helix-turn-helix domain-containing protein [Ruminococcaceae bacterium]|nr:helix-turn-helix domain-containing protein [Oscillospiraceae bacterium]
MNCFSHNLNSIMQEKKVKACDLSRMTGISKARISQYMHGIYIPKAQAMEDIAFALGVPSERLMNSEHVARYKRMRILGDISCGIPSFAYEENGESVITDTGIDADFCLIAKGDSMKDARIYEGDTVFLKECDMVNNGDIAAVIIDDEATLKRVYYYPEIEKIVLIPENPKYEPLIYVGEELNKIRIIGRAVAFRASLL